MFPWRHKNGIVNGNRMTLVLSPVIVAISRCLRVVIRNGGALSWYSVINWLPSIRRAARKDMAWVLP